MTVADDIRSLLDDLRSQLDELGEDLSSARQALGFEIEDLEEQLESTENPEDPTAGELYIMAKEEFQTREDWERYESGSTFAQLPEQQQNWIRDQRGITSLADIADAAQSLSLEDFL